LTWHPHDPPLEVRRKPGAERGGGVAGSEALMTWTARTAPIRIGDCVAYSAAWLRSTGQYSGDMPSARGTVVGLKMIGPVTLAIVNWGNPEIPEKINTKNLCKVNCRECGA
jgi:hypothetical protein